MEESCSLLPDCGPCRIPPQEVAPVSVSATQCTLSIRYQSQGLSIVNMSVGTIERQYQIPDRLTVNVG